MERPPTVTSEIDPNRSFEGSRDGIDGARTCHAAAGTRRELPPPRLLGELERYQCPVPAPPLTGPAISSVNQPP